MENIIRSIEKKIEDYRNKQNDAIQIIKVISTLNKERKYYELLVKYTQCINVCDNEIERLEGKKEVYIELYKEANELEPEEITHSDTSEEEPEKEEYYYSE